MFVYQRVSFQFWPFHFGWALHMTHMLVGSVDHHQKPCQVVGDLHHDAGPLLGLDRIDPMPSGCLTWWFMMIFKMVISYSYVKLPDDTNTSGLSFGNLQVWGSLDELLNSSLWIEVLVISVLWSLYIYLYIIYYILLMYIIIHIDHISVSIVVYRCLSLSIVVYLLSNLILILILF